MSDIGFYKNKFLIPFSLSIFLILHTEKSSNRNIVVIYNLPEPLGIHNYNFLSKFIYNLFLIHILKRGIIHIRKYTFRNNKGLYLDILLDRHIYYQCIYSLL